MTDGAVRYARSAIETVAVRRGDTAPGYTASNRYSPIRPTITITNRRTSGD